NTGTPPRLDSRSIDWSQFEPQPGDEVPTPDSFRTERIEREQIHCHIAYTAEATHRVLRESIVRSPLHRVQTEEIGPRYCPSTASRVPATLRAQRRGLTGLSGRASSARTSTAVR